MNIQRYTQYLSKVEETKSSELRLGQTYMNALYYFDKDLHDKIPEDIDPFYCDDKIGAFLAFVFAYEKTEKAVMMSVEDIADYYHLIVCNQKRKYSGEPYTVHTKAVATMYGEMFPSDNIGIAAAHLHDILEDTPITEDQLKSELSGLFSQEEVNKVVKIVGELTDKYTSKNYPNLNRQERHILEVTRLKYVSDTAKNIKMCDIAHNLSTIPMSEWAVKYAKEKQHLMNEIVTKGHNINPVLFSYAYYAVNNILDQQ